MRFALLVTGLAVLALAGCAAPPAPEPSSSYSLLGGACDPAQLALDVEYRPRDSGAGMLTSDVVVTNVSDVDCELQGSPTISILAADTRMPIGVAIGMDDRDADVVPLPAGGVAYFLIEVAEPFEGLPECTAAPTGGMSVVLPGRSDDTAIVTAAPLARYCDIPDSLTLQVSAFSAEPLEAHVIRPDKDS